MNNDLENIQTIRHLIAAGRHEEAYGLLKQTNHPQVPALEKRLQAIFASRQASERHILPTLLCKLLVGLFMGGLATSLLYHFGIEHSLVLIACFLCGFTGGIITTPAYRAACVLPQPSIARRGPHRQWRW